MASNSRKPRNAPLVENPSTKGGSRQDAAKSRRADRKLAYERNRRQWMITKISAAAIALLVVAGIVFAIVNKVQDEKLNKIPDGVQSFSYPFNNHDDAFTAWAEVPPVGGTHNATWQQCGYYPTQINPGMAVHSLEHGAVWITYSPDLPQDQIDTLKAIAEGEDYILVSPFEGLPSPIVVTAWNKQLTVNSAGDSALRQFIRVFKDSPEYTPEYGATCDNGSNATM